MCTLSDSWALHRVKNCMEIFLYRISILVFDVDGLFDLFYDENVFIFGMYFSSRNVWYIA